VAQWTIFRFGKLQHTYCTRGAVSARSSAASFIALSDEARRAPAATEQRLFRKSVEKVLDDARVILLSGDGSREHLRLDLGRTATAPVPEPEHR
jgi:hypothetical protein